MKNATFKIVHHFLTAINQERMISQLDDVTDDDASLTPTIQFSVHVQFDVKTTAVDFLTGSQKN